jgi:hypothetical protein
MAECRTYFTLIPCEQRARLLWSACRRINAVGVYMARLPDQGVEGPARRSGGPHAVASRLAQVRHKKPRGRGQPRIPERPWDGEVTDVVTNFGEPLSG